MGCRAKGFNCAVLSETKGTSPCPPNTKGKLRRWGVNKGEQRTEVALYFTSCRLLSSTLLGFQQCFNHIPLEIQLVNIPAIVASEYPAVVENIQPVENHVACLFDAHIC